MLNGTRRKILKLKNKFSSLINEKETQQIYQLHVVKIFQKIIVVLECFFFK